jgi:hypothetical protein
MVPANELSDHRFIIPPLPKEHSEDAVAKEGLQRVEIDLRKRDDPPVGGNTPSVTKACRWG